MRSQMFGPVFLAAALCLSQSAMAKPKAAGTGKAGVISSGRIDMTCYPPPPPPGGTIGIGPPPPCVVPVGVPPQFISVSPTGTAYYTVRDDGTVSFDIKVRGLATGMVVSAWLVWYFPGLETPPDPIFIGTPPVADLSVPLAPTTSSFSAGLGKDPNRLATNGGFAEIKVVLDYNPFEAGQGPLRNALAFVNQSLAPVGNVAYQPPCCPGSSYEPVGASFLRSFDPLTGFQILDSKGKPQLIRSPVPGAFIAIVTHLDLQTHGVVAGIPILPLSGQSVSSGDHFLVGMFDIRAAE